MDQRFIRQMAQPWQLFHNFQQCVFSQWILIFSIFSYTVFLVGVLRLI